MNAAMCMVRFDLIAAMCMILFDLIASMCMVRFDSIAAMCMVRLWTEHDVHGSFDLILPWFSLTQ